MFLSCTAYPPPIGHSQGSPLSPTQDLACLRLPFSCLVLAAESNADERGEAGEEAQEVSALPGRAAPRASSYLPASSPAFNTQLSLCQLSAPYLVVPASEYCQVFLLSLAQKCLGTELGR